jgi:hypothetical protein
VLAYSSEAHEPVYALTTVVDDQDHDPNVVHAIYRKLCKRASGSGGVADWLYRYLSLTQHKNLCHGLVDTGSNPCPITERDDAWLPSFLLLLALESWVTCCRSHHGP